MNPRTALIYDICCLVFGATMVFLGLFTAISIITLLGALVLLGVVFIHRREIGRMLSGKGKL